MEKEKEEDEVIPLSLTVKKDEAGGGSREDSVL
jgi:hypothetical protein